jgi:hypothetical protein
MLSSVPSDECWNITAFWQDQTHFLFCFNLKEKMNVKLSLSPRHGDVLGEWSYSSTHTSTSVDDHLHARAVLLPGKEPLYPLDRRLGGPRSRSEHGVKRKIFPAPSGIETRSSIRPARRQSLWFIITLSTNSKLNNACIWYRVVK